MPIHAARAFVQAFQQAAAGVRYYEVEQFRVLLQALNNTGQGLDVREYHGNASQVYFTGQPPWTRIPDARCELSDLCIVWFRTTPHPHGRVTFLQAKRSTQQHAACVAGQPLNERFYGSSTQWRLLSTRPLIRPANKRFHAPPGLLRHALLRSVGSFGVFHRQQNGQVEFMYASADQINTNSHQRSSLLPFSLTGRVGTRRSHGHLEQVSCCCLLTFADALFSGYVGTPFHRTRATRPGGQPVRAGRTTWNDDFLGHLKKCVLWSRGDTEEQGDELWSKFNTSFGLDGIEKDGKPPIPCSKAIILLDTDKLETS